MRIKSGRENGEGGVTFFRDPHTHTHRERNIHTTRMYSVTTSTTSEGGIGLENGAIERTREIERKVNDRMEKFKTETNARHRESMNSMAQLKSTKEAMKDMDLDLAILESSILQSLDELREIYKKIVLSSSSQFFKFF